MPATREDVVTGTRYVRTASLVEGLECKITILVLNIAETNIPLESVIERHIRDVGSTFWWSYDGWVLYNVRATDVVDDLVDEQVELLKEYVELGGDSC